MSQQQYDEYGVLIKPKVASQQPQVDEYGVPIKKKVSGGTSSTASDIASTPSTSPSIPQSGLEEDNSIFPTKENPLPFPMGQPQPVVQTPPSTFTPDISNNFGMKSPTELARENAFAPDNTQIAQIPILSRKNVLNENNGSISDGEDEGVKLASDYAAQQKNINTQKSVLNSQILNIHQDIAAQKGDMTAPKFFAPLPVEDKSPQAVAVNDLHAQTNMLDERADTLRQQTLQKASSYVSKITNDPTTAGLTVRAILGDKNAIQQKESLDNGNPVAPSDKYYNDHQGLVALSAGLDDNYKDNLQDPEYLAKKKSVNDQLSTLIDKYPEFKRQQISKILAQEIMKEHPNIDGMAILPAAKQAAEKLGLTQEDIKNIDFDNLPIQSPISSAVGAIYNGLISLGTGIARVGGSVVGMDNNFLTSELANAKRKAEEKFADVSALQGAPTVVDSDKSSPTYLQDIANPEAGKYNYNFHTISNAIGNGVGALAQFIGGTKMVGGVIQKITPAVDATEAGMAGLMIGQGYEPYYQKAREVISDKPEDEWKRHAYALINGSLDYYAFKGLGKVVKDVSPEAADDAANIFRNASSLADVNRNALEKWTTKVINGVKETAGETAFVGGAQASSEIAKNIVDNTIGSGEAGKKSDRELGDVLLTGAESLPFSIMIPVGLSKVIAGARGSYVYKENIYNAGLNPETYLGQANKLLNDGVISKDQYDQRAQVINTANKIVNSIPSDIELNHNQRVAYTNSKVRELALKSQSEKVDDAALEKYYNDQIQQEVANRTEILNGGSKQPFYEQTTPTNEATQTETEIPDTATQASPTNEAVDNVSKEAEAGTFEDKVRELYPTLKNTDDAGVNDFIKENATDTPSKFINDFGQDKFNEVVKSIPTKELQNKLDIILDNNSDSKDVDILDKLISDRENEPQAEQQPIVNSDVNLSKTKVVDEKGNPLTVYHSTYEKFDDFKDGINYFAEDKDYSKNIADLMNRNGRASDFKEKRGIRTIPVKLNAERIYELPKGQEMNNNLVKGLIKDPEFLKKYDAIKGIDLYSDNKVVYAVFDKNKIINENATTENKPTISKEQTEPTTKEAEGVSSNSNEGANNAFKDVESTAKALSEKESTKKGVIRSIAGKLKGLLHHGGLGKFTSIDENKLSKRDFGFFGKGLYLSELYNSAKSYGEEVSSFVLNPLTKIVEVTKNIKNDFYKVNGDKSALNSLVAKGDLVKLSDGNYYIHPKYLIDNSFSNIRELLKKNNLKREQVSAYEEGEYNGKNRHEYSKIYAGYAKEKNIAIKGLDTNAHNPNANEVTVFSNDQLKHIDNISAKDIAEAYHKAKADGSNPELVKAVEEALSKPNTNETTPTKEVSTPVSTDESKPKAEGVSSNSNEANRIDDLKKELNQKIDEIENPKKEIKISSSSEKSITDKLNKVGNPKVGDVLNIDGSKWIVNKTEKRQTFEDGKYSDTDGYRVNITSNNKGENRSIYTDTNDFIKHEKSLSDIQKIEQLKDEYDQKIKQQTNEITTTEAKPSVSTNEKTGQSSEPTNKVENNSKNKQTEVTKPSAQSPLPTKEEISKYSAKDKVAFINAIRNKDAKAIQEITERNRGGSVKLDKSNIVDAAFETRDGKRIGFDYDTDKVARERFDFSKLKKIGKGSDRTVFDLGDGKVLKVAHTARGLEQNIYEGDHYLKGIVPDVHERGLNYVVTDKVPRIKDNDIVPTYDVETGEQNGTVKAGEMILELSKFTQREFDDKTSGIQDVLNKYGFGDIMNYDVLYGDFKAGRNWGYEDGKPVHIDGGTFGGIQMITSHRGKAPLTNPEFRDIYNKSRALKKQFGDTDKNTKFEKSEIKTDNGTMPVEQYVSRAKAVLEKLFPKARFETYDKTSDYLEAGGAYGSKGLSRVDSKGNRTIMLDLQEIRDSGSGKTAFHEVIHPIVDEVVGEHPEELNPLWNSLASQMKDVEGFDKVLLHVMNYGAHEHPAAEGITELLTQISEGNISLDKVPPARRGAIVDLLNKIFEKLGLSIRFGDQYDFKSFATDIKKAFETGDTESLKSVVDKKSEENQRAKDNASKISKFLFGDKADKSETDINEVVKQLRELGLTDKEIADGLKQSGDSEADIKNALDGGGKSGNGTTTEGGEQGGGNAITHAAVDDMRREFGFEPFAHIKVTDAELNKQADGVLAKGDYDIRALWNDIAQGHNPTPLETVILKKVKTSIEEAVRKNPSKANLKKAVDFANASDVAGQIAGRAFRLRQDIDDVDVEKQSLADFFVARMRNKGVTPETMTDAQKSEIQKQYNDLKDAHDKLEAKVAKLVEADAKKRAENAVKKMKDRTASQPKKTHEEYVKERKSLVEQLKAAKVKAEERMKGITKSGFSVTVTPEMVKIIGKIAYSHVSEGAQKLQEVSQKVFDEIKDVFDGVTKQDVIDVLAGAHNAVKPEKNDILKQMAALRSEAIKESAIAKEKKDAQRLKTIKKTYQGKIDKLKEDLKNGNYLQEKDKPEPLKLDKEALALKYQYISIKQETQRLIAKDEYIKKSSADRFWINSAEALNIMRTIMSSSDFSAVLRQAIVPTIAHPLIAVKSMGGMFRDAFSQKLFDRWLFDLKESPVYDEMVRSKVYISDPNDVRLSKKEEAFMNNFVEKVPVIGSWLVKGSERAYLSYLNRMRVELYQLGADVMARNGKTIENSPKDFEGLGSFVNNMTGRGGVPESMELATPLISAGIFAPRLIASRLNLLGITDIPNIITRVGTAGQKGINVGFYSKLPPEIRRMAITDMAKFVMFGSAVLALSSLIGDDKKNKTVELDPRSSDFGKIRVGDTRYDIWGGMQQYVVFFSRMYKNETKSVNGKMYDLDGKGAFGRTRADVIESFVRGKSSPALGMGWDFVKGGRTIVGDKILYGNLNPFGDHKRKEITGGAYFAEHFLPMASGDITDAIESGDMRNLFAIPATIFGISVQTFNDKK